MSYAADLHLHSYFARGTSPDLTFENLAKWAKAKGIDLLASADFTHPVWFEETTKKLRDRGDGLYEFDGVRFVLGTEVNCTGEEAGKHRRVHML
ncbi:MAG: DNA helicase UvrD, partial [Chloroflexi bacterium]|nr:DNA helicase UvrD [Chloroflexota bacterium]